ncbi:MAG: TraM recognition domain-containing protein [Crocinitomicaceae bacterium]|nr:TraM recognition domain-containing protein [Crocinitomicaceae bacterium]
MPIAAKQIGDLIKIELRNLSSHIQKNIPEKERKNVFFTVDECKHIIDELFLGGLGKMRSSGFVVQLFSQSPKGDFDPTTLDCLIDNTNIHISLRVNSPGSSDFLSKVFGTKKTTKITEQIELNDRDNNTGLGSSREVNEFKINPEEIKSFYRAESFWSIKDIGFSGFVFLDDYYFSCRTISSYEEHVKKRVRPIANDWSEERNRLAKESPINNFDMNHDVFDSIIFSDNESSNVDSSTLQ